jgi:hypothetical protein
MSDDFREIKAPVTPSGALTVDQAFQGHHFPPHQQILLYSPEAWEEFIEEWAHFCLKNRYTQVQRFGGANDRGIDIAAFVDTRKLEGCWDNYQCKHYGRPLQPHDAWPELGKILWYSFNRKFAVPRKYFFVAPRGVGTTLAGYLASATELKNQLIQNWDKQVRTKIGKQEIVLEGELLSYVRAFDFSIFDAKTALQIIEDHRTCPYYRGLRPRCHARCRSPRTATSRTHANAG